MMKRETIPIADVYVPIKRRHRPEAAKALGEETIVAFLVDARKR